MVVTFMKIVCDVKLGVPKSHCPSIDIQTAWEYDSTIYETDSHHTELIPIFTMSISEIALILSNLRPYSKF